ncbi:MAG: hypothetical protein PHI34_04575 [Acidobacteriota bacterium]|nr:hypothetical protein [Acidobacteriota bacterium]
MSVLRSYGKGLQEALIRVQSVFVLWAVTAVFAAVVYAVAARVLAAPLARSLSGDTIMAGGAADALLEVLAGSGPALNALFGVGMALFVAYLFVSPFLYGGVISEVVRPREAKGFAASFWMGGGKYYGRYFRLAVASIALWVPAGLLFVLAGRGLTAIGVDPAREEIQFYLILGRIAAGLFLFYLVKMILDYARIRIAVQESRSALAALGWAALFVLRKPIKTLSLYYLLGLTALAGSAAYVAVQAGFARKTMAAVLAGLFLAQLHILWRCWVKVAFQAAEIKLYTQTAR